MGEAEFNIFALIEFETFSQVDDYESKIKIVHLLACSGFPVMIWYLMVSLMYCYFCSKLGPLWSWGKASIELRKWVCPISKGTLEYNDYPDIYQSINSKNIIISLIHQIFYFLILRFLLIRKKKSLTYCFLIFSSIQYKMKNY